MVYLSAKDFDEEKQDKIDKLFKQILHNLYLEDFNLFFKSLLGTEEYTVLTRRFLAVLLLLDKRSLQEVVLALNMSKSTVSKVQSDLMAGKYEFLVNKFTTKKFHMDDVEKVVETGLRMGGPLPMVHDGLRGVTEGRHLNYRQKYEESEKERRILKKEIHKLLQAL